MRFSLSMVVLIVAVTGFSAQVLAEEVTKEPLSPIQAQLQKMQDGETYGMKTITVPQGASPQSTLPKETLNENAKALAQKAQTEASKPPTRLEMIQDAYKKAATPTDTAAVKVPEEKDKTPEDKEAKKKAEDEKAAQQADQKNEEVMFQTMHADEAPKKPARLIPVN